MTDIADFLGGAPAVGVTPPQTNFEPVGNVSFADFQAGGDVSRSEPGTANHAGASAPGGGEIESLNFVQRYLNPTEFPNIPNNDGSVSTHRMASGEVDGKFIAYPTIVQQPDGTLAELPGDQAVQAALSTGEFLEFATDAEARAFAEGGYKQIGAEVEAEKLGFIGRFKEDIDKRVMMFAEIQKATEEGEQSFGEAIFQTAGKVGAGAVLDFIGQGLVSGVRGISFITPDVIENPMKDAVAGAAIAFINTPKMQAGLEAAQVGLEAWNTWAAQNPRAARNIEATVDIAALIIPAKAKPAAKPVSGPAVPVRVSTSTGNATTEAATTVQAAAAPTAAAAAPPVAVGGVSPSNTVLGRTADRLTAAGDRQSSRKRTEFAEKLVQPKQTPKVQQDQVARSTEQGILRSRVVEPSVAEARAAAELVNIPDVVPSNSLLANANVIRREISSEAESLEVLLKQSPATISAREVSGSLDLAAQRIAAQPLIVGDAAKVTQRLVDEAKRIAATKPNTSVGVLQARREFDRFVQNQRGDAVFDPALENAQSIAVREVRQTLNELIAVKNPSVGVRESLGRQSNLFTAVDNMGPKIAAMYNNAALRLWQNAMRLLPFRGEFNQLLATFAGVGGLGASAIFAPYFTGLAGLGLAGYAGNKLITGAGTKKALAGLIRRSDEAIQAATDPVMISTLRADRALVLELMQKAEGAVNDSRGNLEE